MATVRLVHPKPSLPPPTVELTMTMEEASALKGVLGKCYDDARSVFWALRDASIVGTPPTRTRMEYIPRVD